LQQLARNMLADRLGGSAACARPVSPDTGAAGQFSEDGQRSARLAGTFIVEHLEVSYVSGCGERLFCRFGHALAN
jgi:hypothetical protein